MNLSEMTAQQKNTDIVDCYLMMIAEEAEG